MNDWYKIALHKLLYRLQSNQITLSVKITIKFGTIFFYKKWSSKQSKLNNYRSYAIITETFNADLSIPYIVRIVHLSKIETD